MSDLFPGKKRPELDYGALFAVMKLVIQRKGLQPHPFFITKVRTSTGPYLQITHSSPVFVSTKMRACPDNYLDYLSIH